MSAEDESRAEAYRLSLKRRELSRKARERALVGSKAQRVALGERWQAVLDYLKDRKDHASKQEKL